MEKITSTTTTKLIPVVDAKDAFNFETVKFETKVTTSKGVITTKVSSERTDATIVQAGGKETLTFLNEQKVPLDNGKGGTAKIFVNGTNGDDVINGPGNAFDFISSGYGNDIIHTNNSTGEQTIVFSGEGDDTVFGGSGTDIVLAGSGEDIVIAGAGNDLIAGYEGTDIILGEDGDDRIIGDGVYQGYINNIEVYTQTSTDLIVGGNGNDTIWGDNFIDTGNPFVDDVLNREGQYDPDGVLQNGIGGNDYIYAGNGDDLVYAQSGNDYVTGDLGNDTIYGGNGIDQLFGGEGDDLIDGCAQDDYIEGGEGDDILSGGYGSDVIYGGNGDDTIEAAGIHCTVDSDDVYDYIIAGDGNDNVTGSFGDLYVELGNGDDILDLGSRGNNIIYGGDGNDEISMTPFGTSDKINYIYGEDGDDTINMLSNSQNHAFGGNGDDHFRTGGLNFTADGGEGDDFFEISDDNNGIITSGTGEDLFNFNHSAQQDVDIVITDFDIANDTLYIYSGMFNYTFIQNGNDMIVEVIDNNFPGNELHYILQGLGNVNTNDIMIAG